MSSPRPPRLLEAMAARFLDADTHASSTLGDLAEGYAHRRSRRGWLGAALWYARQTVSLALHDTTGADAGAAGPRPDRLERARHVGAVAVRTLRRRPALTVTISGVLALAIGASLAAFSVTAGTFEAARWWADEDRALLVWPEYPFSRGQLEVLQNESQAFEAVGGILRAPVVIAFPDRSSSATGVSLSPGLFAALRSKPVLGRGLEPEDGRPGNEPVVVLGHGLWQREFGGDPTTLGAIIEVSGVRRRVVGVMPAGADRPGPGSEMWTPLVLDPRDDSFWPARELEVMAIARPGTTVAEARTDVRRVLAALAQRFSFFFPADFGSDATVERSTDRAWGAVSTPLLLLMFGTALLALVAAIDIGNLVLARALERRTEMRVRQALGASRGQLVGQVLAEAGLYAGLAGGGGWAIGAVLSRRIPALFPFGTPVVAASALDPRVIGFVLAISALSWLLVGGVPALHLLWSTRRARPPRRAVRVGAVRWLVVTQAAFATMLLVTAALLLRTVQSLDRLPLGFDPSNVVAAAVAPPATPIAPASLDRVRERIATRVTAMPAVEMAGWIAPVPLLDPALTAPVNLADRQTEVARAITAARFVTDPEALAALRAEVVRGRGFTLADAAGSAPVALVNQAMVRALWPDRDPVGQRIAVDPHDWTRWITVVGVLGDIRYRDLTVPVQPAFFLPRSQAYAETMRLVVRTAMGPTGTTGAMRAMFGEIAPDMPVGEARPLAGVVRDAQGPARVLTALLVLMAFLATALGAVGLHASLAGWVTRRRMEIGTRLALGASPHKLSLGVLSTGVALTTTGVLVGCAGAALAARAIRGLLFGISPLDPLAFLVPAALLLGTSIIAAAVPAWRAASVAPAQVLRDG